MEVALLYTLCYAMNFLLMVRGLIFNMGLGRSDPA